MKKAIFVLALLLFSCETGVDPPRNNISDDLIPLQVGNYWFYKAYSLDPETGDTNGGRWIIDPGYYIADTTTILLDKKITAYKFTNTFYENGIKPPVINNSFNRFWPLLYNDKDGTHFCGRVRNDTIISKFDQVLFPKNQSPGQYLRGFTFTFLPTGDIYKIDESVLTNFYFKASDSLFKTPLGNFKCSVYSMDIFFDDILKLGRADYFIAKGIGIVGQRNYLYHRNSKKYTYNYLTILYKYKIKE